MQNSARKLVFGLLSLLALGASASAAEGDSPPVKGTILRRAAPGKPWLVHDGKEPAPVGQLLLGLPMTHLTSKNGAVELTFLGDLLGLSPLPVLETAIVLKESKDVDLDLVLDRGRIDMVNRKAKGPARVRVQVGSATWNFTLVEPGAKLALEMYGRWAAGTVFSKVPDSKACPCFDLLILALQGEVDAKLGDQRVALHAPPGPALLEWDSHDGLAPSPHRLEKVPDWALPPNPQNEEYIKARARLAKLRERLANKSMGEVMDEFLKSDDPRDRRLALIGMCATDDIERLARALQTTTHADLWDNGITVLRHWIGRSPEHPLVMYKGLIDKAGYTPKQAECAMQLLHSFGEEERGRPETYEVLIRYLNSERPLIRALAHWHLYRLAPAGRKFKYNPAGTKNERAAAVELWEKLLSSGQLPPKN